VPQVPACGLDREGACALGCAFRAHAGAEGRICGLVVWGKARVYAYRWWALGAASPEPVLCCIRCRAAPFCFLSWNKVLLACAIC